MLTVLILAGGKGTRFWPASTENKPKQFLNLIGERTMIQETVNRLLSLVDIDHIFVCTSERYKSLCLQQLPNLSEKNIIIEPFGKNTGPCILLSTLYIEQIYKNTNILVLPSDHQINDKSEFISVIKTANMFVTDNYKSIISIGITPNRPETGYGYINCLETIKKINKYDIKKVNTFVEKPTKIVAEQYLKNGHYLWNAGMFMFNCEFMKNQYKIYANRMYSILEKLPSINSPDYYECLEKKYNLCDAISVDYAIMEKTDNLFVIPADFGWDDIGSWQALERYIKKDENCNYIKGNAIFKDSCNNIVYTNDKPVIILNAKDLFVIETNECVVVGSRESIDEIYKVSKDI